MQCSIHVIGSSAVGEWWATIQCQWYESDWYRKLLATEFFVEEFFVDRIDLTNKLISALTRYTVLQPDCDCAAANSTIPTAKS